MWNQKGRKKQRLNSCIEHKLNIKLRAYLDSPTAQLFPYGDDNYGKVPINFTFNYFNYNFTKLIIDTNGYIYFSGSKCCQIEFPHSGNGIAAMNYDLNTNSFGEIVYENLNSSSSDFEQIKKYLNIVPTQLFRISFVNVPDFDTETLDASFQIILATDNSKFKVLLIYYYCLNGSPLMTPAGIYYLSKNGTQASYLLSTNPCTDSNLVKKVNGVWVFETGQTDSNIT